MLARLPFSNAGPLLLLRNSWLLGGRGLDDLESELGGFPLELLDL
jgi:hypothetical protein